MKITIVQFPNSLKSAVYGVADLLIIAKQAALTVNNQARLSSEIVHCDEITSRRTSALGDVLFLPPLFVAAEDFDEYLAQQKTFISWLRRLKRSKTIISACCTAVPLLAQAGLLNQHKATTTWWALPYLQNSFPKVKVQPSAMLVDDANIITSAGPFSYVSQVLHLLQRFVGHDVAQLCAKMAVVEPGRPANGIFVVPTLYQDNDPFMLQVREVIVRDLALGVSVAKIAKAMGMSERTLHRRLKAKSNHTPRDLIAHTRIEVAKTLLESSADSIANISARVGFEDDSSFRSAFSRVVGTPPASYRARMNMTDLSTS